VAVTKWHDKEIMNRLEYHVKRNLNTVGVNLQREIKKNLSLADSKTLVKGTKGSFKRTRHPNPGDYSAKQPGGFPRFDTGQLAGSIDFKVGRYNKKGYRRSFVTVVGANKEYAKHLELGNPKNNVWLPFMRPTLEANRLKIVKALNKDLVSNLRSSFLVPTRGNK
jgi:hypothetical protein